MSPNDKRCCTCKLFKPVTEFHKDNQTTDGLCRRCKSCKHIKSVEYYWDNRDALLEKQRETYAANPEKKLLKNKEWQQENPERLRIIQKRHYDKNPEKRRNAVSASSKKHRDKRRKYEADYRALHPEFNKVKTQKRQAVRRQLPDNFTSADWLTALNYFNGCCAVCGRPPGLWHTIAMDHWIPLSSPDCPGTVPTNIIPLCHGMDGCNNSKGHKHPAKWLIAKCGKKKADMIIESINHFFAHTQS